MRHERRRSSQAHRYTRRINFREPVQKFLIVCEGKKTEKNYFEAFRVPKDIRTIEVRGMGQNTVSLVREAIRLKSQDDYDQTWCVLDIEDYSPQNIYQAIQMAQQNDIHVVYSNQAFEIWYLLHYHYYNTAIPRKDYFTRLSEHIGLEYQKNSEEMYGILLSRQSQAIQNARRLLDNYKPPDPCNDDPSTMVHCLVEELNKYTPESRKER